MEVLSSFQALCTSPYHISIFAPSSPELESNNYLQKKPSKTSITIWFLESNEVKSLQVLFSPEQ